MKVRASKATAAVEHTLLLTPRQGHQLAKNLGFVR